MAEPSREWEHPAPVPLHHLSVASGGSLTVGAGGRHVVLYDGSGGTILSRELGQDVYSLSLTPGGDSLAVTTTGGWLHLFGAGGKPLWQVEMARNRRPALALASGGRYAAVGSDDGTVFLFDAKGSLLWKRRPSKDSRPVRSVAVSASGDYVSAGTDSTVALFDNYGTNFAGTVAWEAAVDGRVEHLSMSGDGFHIAAATASTLYLFDRTGKEAWKYPVEGTVTRMDASASAEHILLAVRGGGDLHEVYLFHRERGLIWRTVAGPSPVEGLSLPAVHGLAAAVTAAGDILLFHHEKRLAWKGSLGEPCTAVAMSPEGLKVAVASGKGRLVIYDAAPLLGELHEGKAEGDEPLSALFHRRDIERRLDESGSAGDTPKPAPARPLPTDEFSRTVQRYALSLMMGVSLGLIALIAIILGAFMVRGTLEAWVAAGLLGAIVLLAVNAAVQGVLMGRLGKGPGGAGEAGRAGSKRKR